MRQSLKIILLLIWPYYLNDFYLIRLGNSDLPLLWGLDVVFYTLIPVLTLLWLLKTGQISLQTIGLKAPFDELTIPAALILCGLLFLVFHRTLDPFLFRSLPPGLFSGYPFPPTQPWKVLTVTYAAVTAGVLEEVIQRGIVLSELEKHLSSRPIIIFSGSCLFGLMHWSNGPALVISDLLIGAVFATWFVYRRSLWVPMIAHGLYDFIIFSGISQ